MPLSLTGKRWQIREWDEEVVRQLSESLSIEPVVAGVLYLRGVRTKEQGEIFLEPGLSQLRNPLKIPGIIEAAERIVEAIENKEKICIYGDYDVDGVTATSLMVLVLGRLGADLFYFLPHRMKHGYGLHPEAVREVRERGTDLIITVDNGIAAVDEIALARSLDMEVIVTDHHEPPVDLPDTPYIINPKVHEGLLAEDGSSEVEHFLPLAGVGLAFALLIAVRSRLRERPGTNGSGLPNLREYLDLVAIGTIGDVAPITGENRILVRHGLREIMQSKNIGLRALIKVAGLNESVITPGHVGFMLAPRINAAGRLGDAGIALRLLTSSDSKVVEEAATVLNQENLKRQEIEKEILEQALAQIEAEGRDDKVIVLHSEEWHPGVIGIVASRIVERFYRPTIMITRKNGKGTGSGRSTPGFSLYNALEACREELQGFGGHKMAAGLTLSRDRIRDFRESINRYAESVLKQEDLIPTIKVDGILEPAQISEGLLQGLEQL